jgi:hypothetical protein
VSQFIEEAVAVLIQQRLGPKRRVWGILHTAGERDPEEPLPLVDGIIQDPQKGAITLQNGRLAIVDARVCSGVILINAGCSNIAKLESRLWVSRSAQLRALPDAAVMGVVVRDGDPRKKSWVSRKGNQFHSYDGTTRKWCPIYILFSYRNGAYEPHRPAIRALLENIHNKIHAQY